MAWAFARSGVLALAVIVVGAAPGAAAAAPTDRDLARLGAAQGHLVAAQSAGDGGLPLGPGSAPDDLAPTEAWGALGLAAAGVNAQDQARPGGPTLSTYLERQVAPLLSHVPDLSLYALLAHAVGADVHDLGGVDLVPAILDAQVRAGGGFGDQAPATVADARSTALAALALRAAGGTAATDAADAGVQWLVANQDPILHAWPRGAPDVETTALALQALVAGGRSGSAAAAWLQGRQGADGGIGPDVRSAAAAAMGLVAAGVDPHNVSNGGPSLMDFLGAAQDPSGVVGGPRQPTLTTGYAMLAYAAVTLPFGPIARGGAGAGLPPQGPPAGLPRGPTLPVETSAPATPTTPTTPTPTPPVAAPVIQPAARAPATPASGVRRVTAHRKAQHKPARTGDGDGSGTGLAGDGTGTGGGGGTLSTPGAPDRAGGGGGSGQASAPAPTAGTPLPSGARRGGTPTRSAGDRAREVAGTLIGRDSATPGAAGSALAAPGAAGSRGGGHHAPWWVVALVALLAAGLAAGVRLDRRRPDFAL